jgi:hypothetical protein
MRRFYLLILVLVAFSFAVGGDHTMVASVMDEETRVKVTQELQRLPLYFIENKGQLDQRVAYYVQGKDKTLYFTQDPITKGVLIALTSARMIRQSPWSSILRSLFIAAISAVAAQTMDGASRWTNRAMPICAGRPTPPKTPFR